MGIKLNRQLAMISIQKVTEALGVNCLFNEGTNSNVVIESITASPLVSSRRSRQTISIAPHFPAFFFLLFFARRVCVRWVLRAHSASNGRVTALR